MGLVLMAAIHSYAHGPRGSRNPSGENYRQAEGREEGGGEFTGQVAAWLFGIANFPVVFSLLLRTCGKAAPERSSFTASAGRINRIQKKYLMKLHYWLNPAAMGVAVIHFSLTECQATAMPEFGLGFMSLTCILGLMVTFRLSPAFMRKAVLKLHTSPIMLIAGIAILLIGHSMIE
jgi:hypothetical protein